MLNKFIQLIKGAKDDSLKRSMLLSMLCKPLGMVISFIYTPMLLAYLGDESYGIWSTILSVINWINYFDVGIGQGLRNSLARYIAIDKKKEARESVSTGYVVLSVISSFTFLIGTILILVLNMGIVFNTNIPIKPALMVSFTCISINFVLGLSRSQLYATQQAEKVSFMTILVQIINLIGILLLSITSHGNLLAVALIVGLSGIIVNLIFTRDLWKKYSFLIPDIRDFKKSEFKNVANIGIKFFLIQIAVLVLYSSDNMIITQLFGPSFVTPYHTTYTAFGIVGGVFSAMMSPLWSKYTVAMEHKDYVWIKRSVIKFDKILPVIAVILFVGVILFKPLATIWLHRELAYEEGLIACMAVYFFLQIWGSIYSTVLNGIGHVNLQLIFAVFTAILNIPLSIFLGRYCGLGTTGVLLATIICMLISNIPLTIHTHRFFNRKISEQVFSFRTQIEKNSRD